MIEEVRLRNFLSHSETTIKLEEGLNVFVGPNGAGKSSVIDAITFALFGEHTRGSSANLVRRGSGGAEVQVTFSVAGDRYVASRGLEGSGRLLHAELKKLEGDPPVPRILVAGERKKTDMESVSRYVESILGMGYKELRLASIVQQGELDSILELQPRELKELINRLIGIEDLDRAFSLSRDVIDGFKEVVRKEVGLSVDDVETLEAEMRELSLKEPELRSSVESLEARMRELEAMESSIRSELEAMEPLRKKAEEARVKLASLVGYVLQLKASAEMKRRELVAELKEAPSRIELSSTASALERELEEVERELEEVGERLASARAAKRLGDGLRSDLDGKEEELRSVERELEEVERELARIGPRNSDALEKELGALKSEVEELAERRGGLRRELENLETLRRTGVCPTCGRSAEGLDLEARRKELDKELQDVEWKVKELYERIRGLEEELRAARSAETMKERAAQLRKRAEALRSDVGALRERLASALKEAANLGELEDRKRELEGRRRELEGKLRAARDARAWLEAKGISGPQDLRRLEEELRSIEELLSRIPEDPRSADPRALALDDHSKGLVQEIVQLMEQAAGYDEKRFSELNSELDRIMREKASVSSELGGARATLKQAMERRSQLEAKLEVLRRARKYLEIYDRIRGLVFHRDGRLASGLRRWAIEALSEAASEHIRMFGIGISSIQLREEREEVDVECYGQAGRMSVEAMSGGERVAVALALRFAMARLVGGSRADFIILDEPTANLDSERRRKLVDLVAAIGGMSGPLRQIVLITHDREAFEEAGVEAAAIFSFSRGPNGTSVTRS